MNPQSPFEKLPEDILHRIHSLLPVQDAACAACVSHAFLHSWRCYTKLTLNDSTLRLTHIKFEERKIYFIDRVDKILKNHHDKGVKVETLNLILTPCTNIKASYLDRWLRRTVKSGFKDLYLEMPLSMKKIYNFPCSVLSDEGAASSIQFLKIGSCAFRPTSTLGSMGRLKILSLSFVHITEEGLQHLLSKSSTLEELRIFACNGIICLKIPCTMHHLKILDVQSFNMPRVVEIDAPNLCYFKYDSALPEIYVRNRSQLKHVQLSSARPSGVLFYARTSLPSIARNVESLILVGCGENANTPLLQSKLPHLKNLEIRLGAGCPTSYDVFSLVSFLDASPALESFTLHASHYPYLSYVSNDINILHFKIDI
ncbi:F-box/LRR-repeat protein At3g58940-like [Hordeum vulgare subsp. vulgare]|uniref:F-box/LRR-repeat protein At3g58940-like n=1 Tax=Hordeum vulgare subsp. vulgare TaxID=112509 RepID=UPI001D1A3D1D|nr:F-box/LRR-repeat protein At3g58940-like [Hordeum vulgare subsp. vulgare]